MWKSPKELKLFEQINSPKSEGIQTITISQFIQIH